MSAGKALQKPFAIVCQQFEVDKRGSPNVEDILSHIRSLQAAAGTDKVRGLEAAELDGLVAGTARPVQRAIQVQNLLPDGSCVLTMMVETGRAHQVQCSTNLIDWGEVSSLVPTNFVTQVTDYTSTNFARRYYRLATP